MDKLLHKVKREKKAAKKDLRKDTAFLSKQKAKEARERYAAASYYTLLGIILNFWIILLFRDMERQKRTREIMSGLGSQEGEYRKFMASKKRKK